MGGSGGAGWTGSRAAKLGWTMGRIPTVPGVQADSESRFQFMLSLCWNVRLPFLTPTHFKNPVQIIRPFVSVFVSVFRTSHPVVTAPLA